MTVTVGNLDDGFYVEDDGPGIPPSERDRVFEEGYSTADGGTGFGLAIVDRVAETHGWTVRVTGGTSGGTRVEVRGVDGNWRDPTAGGIGRWRRGGNVPERRSGS